MRYAIVENDTVTNVILWDGEEEYEAPEGCALIEVTEEVSIGWARQGSEFVAPPEPTPEPYPGEAPEVTEARETAYAELVALGVSDATARTIAGLSPATTNDEP